MYSFVAPVVIFCGHSAPQKYGVNIRLGRYSFCPYDTQPLHQLLINCCSSLRIYLIVRSPRHSKQSPRVGLLYDCADTIHLIFLNHLISYSIKNEEITIEVFREAMNAFKKSYQCIVENACIFHNVLVHSEVDCK